MLDSQLARLRLAVPPRPVPPPDVAGVPGLVRSLRARIRRRGPIPFREVMEAALYHPRYGYALRAAPRVGPEGDFLTSPTVHPAFGWCLARQLAQQWETMGRPARFDVVEVGAAEGQLAVAILDYAQRELPAFYGCVRYALVEVNPHARCAAALAGHPTRWAAWPPPPGSVVGCILANELLDSFPVILFEVRGGRAREVLVEWREGRLAEALGPPLEGPLGERIAALQLPDGYRGEVNPGVEPWVAEAAGALARGYLLLLDYGYPRRELYKPARRRGTLLCYYRHTLNDEPLRRLGLQDITAHVDLDAVREAALANGLEEAGRTDQLSFLVALGLGPELADLGQRPETTLEQYVALKTDLLELLNPGGLGRLAVLAFRKSVPSTPLRGFAESEV